MKKQNSLSAAYGYQADLFGATPVKKKIAKPAPERYEALRVLALRYGGIGVTATQYAIKTGEVYHAVFPISSARMQRKGQKRWGSRATLTGSLQTVGLLFNRETDEMAKSAKATRTADWLPFPTIANPVNSLRTE